jgi:Ni,Fe-hydrogenase III large subunit
MTTASTVTIHNTQAIPFREVPELWIGEFRRTILGAVANGCRIVSLSGLSCDAGRVKLLAVLASDNDGTLSILSTVVKNTYPALTPECQQAQGFERELAEEFGIRPEGHPWLKPIRFSKDESLPGVTDFYKVTGEEVHEVAVGPIHAGIIEPGHFRFQCHGEEVFHLEISLGYQHRGVERALIGGPDLRTIHYMETAAGDSTAAQTTAYCQLIETLGKTRISPHAQVLRAVALELERLANHTGDLGAMAGDIGYLPTSSYCGRIRGDFLNMTALICGNRFSRDLITPGGVAHDLGPYRAIELRNRLAQARKDVTAAVNLLWNTPSVLARFEETGTLSKETARDLGLVGVAARACGLDRDCRFTFPSGMYRFAQIPVSTCDSGDVFARAQVRWLEIQRSLDFLEEQLATMPDAPTRMPVEPPAPDMLAVSMVEGWRGELCHVAVTGPDGRFVHYKIVDPSFHNWMGLAMAMRGQQISDFPVCNKSFNLSYCGHDL